MTDYKVKFEVFEGPLDLLLYLIKKEEIDIYEVNLTQLATQFLEYIEVMRMLDLEIAGEFLVMAATLMYIKSRELLPRDQQVQTEGEDDGEDPRWELIRQLVEYKKFKDAAARLQQLEIAQENTFPRVPGKPEFPDEPSTAKPSVSLFDLVSAVGNILKRFTEKAEDEREIFQDRWTVSEKIEFIVKLLDEKAPLKFSELFAEAASRTEVVVTFLALLELIRLKQIVALQQEEFGEIEIAKSAEADQARRSVPAEPSATSSEPVSTNS